MRNAFAAALIALAVVGCADEKQRKEQHELGRKMRAEKLLPPNTKNFRSLGNDWYYFEMELEGRNRKFLYRCTGMGNDNVESVVELQP